MIRFACVPGLITLLATIAPGITEAQTVALDPGKSVEEKRSGWLPYAFSIESFGTTIGAAAFSSAGKQQPQSSIFGTAFGSANDTWGVIGSLTNFRIPRTRRWFMDVYALAGHFTDSRFYVDLDTDPAQNRAGSNGSDADDFVTGVSNDIQLDLTFKIPLPLGGAADEPVGIYNVYRGLLRSGPKSADDWNPLHSGRTTFKARFFARYQDLEESREDDRLVARTNGLELVLEYDNTDFPRNPSRGSRQKIHLSRDFGLLNSTNSWTNVKLDLAKYVDLGYSSRFRQRVLAFNFWTSNTLSWKTEPGNPRIVSHRPPPYMGSTLGGFDRLRAYPSGRFSDKAAVYYSAELRVIPQTPPLRQLKLFDYFEVDWLQIVPFVEAGRVGPSYNAALFTDDLKYTAGIDIRMMAFRNVFRIGLGHGDEGNQIWAMIGQTFAR